MTNYPPKIVVVTPVKNEQWILDRFLSVTSQFADCIIVADQNSTDGSPNICQKYAKVTLIENKSDDYDEASRQILLINKAREIVPEHKIILALDADEILAADATKTLGWQSMLKAKPGTVLCFEKLDLYLTPHQAIRYDVPWPIGYVDDGIHHQPKKIHSIRIPLPQSSSRLNIHDVKILHYALTNQIRQNAKMRMYSVIENVLGTIPFLLTRRLGYSSNKNWTQQGRLEPSPKEWFAGWEAIGIDMFTIECQKYNWQDFEVIKYFKKYGCRRFWLDDIWNFDWESFRLHAIENKVTDVPDYKISTPPKIVNLLCRLLDKLYFQILKISN